MIPLKTNITQINLFNRPRVHRRLVRPFRHGSMFAVSASEANGAGIPMLTARLIINVVIVMSRVGPITRVGGGSANNKSFPNVTTNQIVHGINVFFIFGIVEDEGFFGGALRFG